MINPELIVGMLFLPSMADNEAIEIVGAERFSSYTGYASSFLFSEDYIDQKAKDAHGRRRTRIVAIDALSRPGAKQYKIEYLLREANKAFCGFMDQSRFQEYRSYFNEDSDKSNMGGNSVAFDVKHASLDENDRSSARCDLAFSDATPLSTCCIETNSNVLASSASAKAFSEKEQGKEPRSEVPESSQVAHDGGSIGVATGNWGCGVFGGDPELKCTIQWLAASQARRPFVLYYTFAEPTLQRLKQVTEWILSHNWTVGDLWNMLVEYSRERLNGVDVGFLDWVLPPDDSTDEEIPTSFICEDV
ncbi:unnamed protein product [Victoria cruziana]